MPPDAALLSDADLAAFTARRRWLLQARSPDRGGKQIPPPDDDWEILLWVAGRGFGKSLSIYQYGWWEAWRVPGTVGHVVAPTLADVRGTSFEGPVGLCNITPPECLLGGSVDRAYNKSTHELRFANGSLIRGFGAVEEAGRLRGPQCHFLMGDEIREWDRPAGNLEQAMSNALFGLRLVYEDGTPSRAVMGTTPKPIPYLKKFEKRPGVRVVRGRSYENLRNLSASYRSHLMSLAGTLLGRQEIDAEYIDEADDATIIKRSWMRLFPAFHPDGRPRKLPEFHFVCESIDAASSEDDYDRKKAETDPTAYIVLGVFNTHDALSEQERSKLKVRGRYAALLLDCWDERLGLPELLDKVRSSHRLRWGPPPGRMSNIAIIEDKSSGPALRQMLAKWGVPCWPANPRTSKTMRAHGIAPVIQQGGLFIPESAHLGGDGRPDRRGLPRNWCDPFLDQVCSYAGPGSTPHDDYVDALTQAVSYLSDRGMLEAKPDVQFLDAEEKREHDRAEAARLLHDQEAREYVNPYAA